MYSRRFGCRYVIGIRVVQDFPIPQLYNSSRIVLCKLRIMRYHNDQAILCDTLQQIHHLNACFGVQRTRRFICEKNIRIIHKRPRNRNALHLTAGHLIRLFMQLIPKTDLFQRLLYALSAFPLRDSGNRQRKFNIRQDRLMRYQIIALKNKPNGMIAIGIPITVAVYLRGNSANYKITAVIPIQSANDVQKRCLSRTARS